MLNSKEKTNHQRNFVSTFSSKGERAKYIRKAINGTHVGKAISPDGELKLVLAKIMGLEPYNGKKGQRKAVLGMKKYIRSRTRFYENQSLREFIKNNSEVH